ncbi:CU044_5270 family protein [Actinomadura sp. DC4]|uniref:CU044_5270 family protein n=1 Tax=Actinomadura sp. DC4 TaxID=3055069 RepID=UPI0025B00ABD|nr:CU044_5270 family protein [Actinomadura sp. DC4]MDN3352245.1 CU044_5270 family protein [Actinomadura sp. DC4]
MMDELKILQDAWGEAAAPSTTARAQARMALLERAAGRRHARRRLRPPGIGIRLVAVGAMAAAIAAGVTVVRTTGGTDGTGRPRSVLPGIPAGPVANAAEALDRAAAAADARPFTPPRPGQWVYRELRVRTSVHASGGVTEGPYTTYTQRHWERADGKKSAEIQEGRLKVFDETGRTIPPEGYYVLAALPTDPAALLRWVDAENGEKPGSKGEPRNAFETLSVILRENLLPPRTEAAIFRAMKRIPGVTLVDHAADAAGRPAIALGVTAEGWLHEEVMLDPKSYTYLGERAISIKGHTLRGVGSDLDKVAGYVKKGVLQHLTVRTVVAVVDRPGQRD